jgi:hypothetical protein
LGGAGRRCCFLLLLLLEEFLLLLLLQESNPGLNGETQALRKLGRVQLVRLKILELRIKIK